MGVGWFSLEDDVLNIGEGNAEGLQEEVEDIAVEGARSTLLRTPNQGEAHVHLKRQKRDTESEPTFDQLLLGSSPVGMRQQPTAAQQHLCRG